MLNDFPKYLLKEDCKYPRNNSSSPKPTINAKYNILEITGTYPRVK